MISFKSFLIESRSSPLYHGTNNIIAREIIKTNKVKGLTLQSSSVFQSTADKNRFGSKLGSGVRGVSLSRSFNVSKRFGNIIFEFAQDKLIQRYKIKPINHWNSYSAIAADNYKDEARSQKHQNDNEFEEFLLGDILDASKYIKTIWVPEVSLKYWPDIPNVKGY